MPTLAKVKFTLAEQFSMQAALMDLARTLGPQKYVCRNRRKLMIGLNEGTAENTYADPSLELGVSARKILTSLDGVAHAAVDGLPVGTTEHGPGAQESKRIVFSASVVDCNVPQHVLSDFLGKVDVDAEEVGCVRKS